MQTLEESPKEGTSSGKIVGAFIVALIAFAAFFCVVRAHSTSGNQHDENTFNESAPTTVDQALKHMGELNKGTIALVDKAIAEQKALLTYCYPTNDPNHDCRGDKKNYDDSLNDLGSRNRHLTDYCGQFKWCTDELRNNAPMAHELRNKQAELDQSEQQLQDAIDQWEAQHPK
jgi:hypothetical protein